MIIPEFTWSDEEHKSILRIDRHNSQSPFQWYGPSPEPWPASRECPCVGCEARFYDEIRKGTGG